MGRSSWGSRFALAWLLLAGSVVATAQPEPFRLDYSVDIGSDLDLADPLTPANNTADAGDVYLEPDGPFGGLIKDDTGFPLEGFPLAGDVMGFETGTFAQQPVSPAPVAVPTFTVGGAAASDVPVTPSLVRLNYNNAFDLDASDQLQYAVPHYREEDGQLVPGFTRPLILDFDRERQAQVGITFEPQALLLSFDDDSAPGWYLTADSVPTTSPPHHGDAVRRDEVVGSSGDLLGGYGTPGGVRDEAALGLGANPPTFQQQASRFDDDVDALDTQRHPLHYFSVDHEANYSGYLGGPFASDPGSIYVTDLATPGPNQLKVLDDELNFGVPMDTDIDAFEFASVSLETFFELFEYDPFPAGDVAGDILIGLFSVDQNDPDNDERGGPGVGVNDLHGDESGGLMPGVVYASDLVASFTGSRPVPVARYEGEDVDALTVLAESLGKVICGDYNGSGQVEQGDLDLVLQNWGTGTFTGDPAALPGGAFDGTVDQNELDKVLQNWGATSAPSLDAALVPEPGMFGVLALCGLATRRRRTA